MQSSCSSFIWFIWQTRCKESNFLIMSPCLWVNITLKHVFFVSVIDSSGRAGVPLKSVRASVAMISFDTCWWCCLHSVCAGSSHAASAHTLCTWGGIRPETASSFCARVSWSNIHRETRPAIDRNRNLFKSYFKVTFFSSHHFALHALKILEWMFCPRLLKRVKKTRGK